MTASSTKDVPRKGMQCLCVHTQVQTQWLFFLYIDEEMCLDLKPILENNALYQNNETQLWHQLHAHKIVHSSAMYYHNLNVIRKGI